MKNDVIDHPTLKLTFSEFLIIIKLNYQKLLWKGLFNHSFESDNGYKKMLYVTRENPCIIYKIIKNWNTKIETLKCPYMSIWSNFNDFATI